jgi:hypothetical protein
MNLFECVSMNLKQYFLVFMNFINVIPNDLDLSRIYTNLVRIYYVKVGCSDSSFKFE